MRAAVEGPRPDWNPHRRSVDDPYVLHPPGRNKEGDIQEFVEEWQTICDDNNLIIVALSIGMGVIPIAVPTFYEHFPSWFQTVFDSGISSAAVTAVLLNLLFNVGRSGESTEAALVAESPTVGVTPDYDVPGGK